MKNNKKEKKKNKVLSHVISCLVGVILGLFIAIQGVNLEYGIFRIYLILLVVVLIALFVATVTHEAGHLLFGYISGYEFCSFRVGSFALTKENEKLKFRSYSVAGTMGQCLMIPPETSDGKIPFVLYNLGGVIINVFVGILTLPLYFVFSDFYFVSSLLLAVSLISFCFAFANGVPRTQNGFSNDGMNTVTIRKDPTSLEPFRLQLVINAEMANGKRSRDLPSEYFEISENADLTNIHFASIAVFACSRLMDEGRFDEALEKMNELINSNANIAGIHRSLMILDCIYIHLLKGDIDTAESLLTPEQKKFMKAGRKAPNVIRTEYAVARIIDKNEKMAKNLKQNFEKVLKQYPYSGDAEMEKELLLLVDNVGKTEEKV